MTTSYYVLASFLTSWVMRNLLLLLPAAHYKINVFSGYFRVRNESVSLSQASDNHHRMYCLLFTCPQDTQTLKGIHKAGLSINAEATFIRVAMLAYKAEPVPEWSKAQASSHTNILIPTIINISPFPKPNYPTAEKQNEAEFYTRYIL